MEAHTDHDTPGRVPGPWRVVVGVAILEQWLDLYFGCKEVYIRKKSCKMISAIGVTDLREYKKRFLARSGERETEEDRETIQSRRGSRPSTAMEAMDQRGNSPPV